MAIPLLAAGNALASSASASLQAAAQLTSTKEKLDRIELELIEMHLRCDELTAASALSEAGERARLAFQTMI